MIRKLSVSKIDPMLSVFYYSVCGTVVAGVATFASNSFKMPCQSHLIYILLLGITGLFGQLFFAAALIYERTTTVSVLKSMDIVFALVLQVLLLNDIPSLLNVLGAALIFSSAVGIAIRKLLKNVQAKKKKKEEDAIPITSNEN
jgi:drug/metabolite transporter (DMT)-like permease